MSSFSSTPGQQANVPPGIEINAVPPGSKAYAWIGDGLQLVLFGWALDIALFSGTEVLWLNRGLVIGGLIVCMIRSSCWPLLFAIQASLLFREPRNPQLMFGIGTFVYCFMTLTLLTYACNYKKVRPAFSDWLGRGLSGIVDPKSPVDRSLEPARWNGRSLLGAMSVRLATLMAVVLASMLLFLELPISRGARDRWWQLSRTGDYTLWPGPNILVLGIALLLVFWHSNWKQMSPSQSRVYLRSTFLRHHFRDLRMIALRRLKAAKRK